VPNRQICLDTRDLLPHDAEEIKWADETMSTFFQNISFVVWCRLVPGESPMENISSIDAK
jgi:hypothetical protein